MNLFFRRMVSCGLVPGFLFSVPAGGWGIVPVGHRPNTTASLMCHEALAARMLTIQPPAHLLSETTDVREQARPQAKINGLTRMSDEKAMNVLKKTIRDEEAIVLDGTLDPEFFLAQHLTVEKMADYLLAGFREEHQGINPTFLKNYLSHPENVRRFHNALMILKRTIESSKEKDWLKSYRYVILLPMNPHVLSGKITAFQSGKNRPTIYLGMEALEFAEHPLAPKGGLLAVLEHESHHLNNNPKPDYRPDHEPMHSYSSEEEFRLTEAFRSAFETFHEQILIATTEGLEWGEIASRAAALCLLGIPFVLVDLINVPQRYFTWLDEQTMEKHITSLTTSIIGELTLPTLKAARFTMTVRAVSATTNETAKKMGKAPAPIEIYVQMEKGSSTTPFFAEHPTLKPSIQNELIRRIRETPVYLSRFISTDLRDNILEFHRWMPLPLALQTALNVAYASVVELENRADFHPITIEHIDPVVKTLHDLNHLINQACFQRAKPFLEALLESEQQWKMINNREEEMRRFYQGDQEGEKNKDVLARNNGIDVMKSLTRGLEWLSTADPETSDISYIFKLYQDLNKKGIFEHDAPLKNRMDRFMNAIHKFLFIISQYKQQIPGLHQAFNPQTQTHHNIVGFSTPEGKTFAATSQLSFFVDIENPKESISTHRHEDLLGNLRLFVDEGPNVLIPQNLREVPGQSLQPALVEFTNLKNNKRQLADTTSADYQIFRDNLIKSLRRRLFPNDDTASWIMNVLLASERGVFTVVFGSMLAIELALEGSSVINVYHDESWGEEVDQLYEELSSYVEAAGGQIQVITGAIDNRLANYLRALPIGIVVALTQVLDPAILMSLFGTRERLILYLGRQPISWETYAERLEKTGWKIINSGEIFVPDADLPGHFYELRVKAKSKTKPLVDLKPKVIPSSSSPSHQPPVMINRQPIVPHALWSLLASA